MIRFTWAEVVALAIVILIGFAVYGEYRADKQEFCIRCQNQCSQERF
jgi:hypothetical protein